MKALIIIKNLIFIWLKSYDMMKKEEKYAHISVVRSALQYER